MDYEVGEGGLFVGVVDDGPAQFEVIAYSRDYVFDEVVAIVKSFLFKQLGSRMVQFNIELVVGSH